METKEKERKNSMSSTASITSARDLDSGQTVYISGSGADPKDMDAVGAAVDDPVFRDSGFGVEEPLDLEVFRQRRISDFDGKLNVIGSRVMLSIPLGLDPKEVRLGSALDFV